MAKHLDQARKNEWLPAPGAKPHILFLFSDTGGGHRAAMDAIIEALQLEYGDAITIEMVDFLKEYAPPPYNQLPRFYPEMVKLPEFWGVGYKISDGRRQARIMTSTFWPIVRRAARRLRTRHGRHGLPRGVREVPGPGGRPLEDHGPRCHRHRRRRRTTSGP